MALSKNLRRHRGWIATGLLVAIAATAYLVYQRSLAEEATVSYTTERATVGTISVTVAGTGSLEIDGTTDVYPDVAGQVASVTVTEGSAVTTGTVLFTLDSASAEAATARALASYRQSQQQVAQANAQLAKAEATLAELERRSAEPTSTVTSTDLAAAEAEVSSAAAALASAKASATTTALDYESAQDAEDDLTVTSPCSGVVWSLGVEAGDTVSTGGGSETSGAATAASTAGDSSTTDSTSSTSAPVVIAPEQPLAVHLTVNEVDLPALALGQRADIEFDAFPDLTATGKVYEISSEGTNSQGVVTFDVWISLDVADDDLRAGMSAAATIVTEVASDALIVPNASVKSDGEGGSYVEVLDESGDEPHRVVIETGLESATQTQVLSGLAVGDAVVTQTVDATEDESTDQAPGGMMVPGMGGGPRD